MSIIFGSIEVLITSETFAKAIPTVDLLANSKLVSHELVAVLGRQLSDGYCDPLLDWPGLPPAGVLALEGQSKLITNLQEGLLLHVKILDPLLVISSLHNNVAPPVCACGPVQKYRST